MKQLNINTLRFAQGDTASSLKNSGVLQHPQAPTCPRPWVTVTYLAIAEGTTLCKHRAMDIVYLFFDSTVCSV